MMLIETYIKPSPISGLGLFARVKILKGQEIWRFEDGFDTLITEDFYNTLPKVTQETILHYMFFSKDLNGYVIMPDDARFFNHSVKPNTITIPDSRGHKEPMTVALRDIEEDEELTCDYFEFDASAVNKIIS